MQRPLKIGTRGSPLALYQARLVQRLLGEADELPSDLWDQHFPVVIFTTSGDRLKGKLSEFGGKGLFTKELEESLLNESIDLAVHSMKDVPTVHQPGLSLGAVLTREDPRDAFVSTKYDGLAHLPENALIGTASLRRRAQLAHHRPDIRFSLLRGNVGTRLQRLKEGVCDGTFLAVAGLNRLGQSDHITEAVSVDHMLPAPAQGAIGVEIRANDHACRAIVERLNDPVTHSCINTERIFLNALDGSCRTPIAALATLSDGKMHFRGDVYSTDGQLKFARAAEWSVADMDSMAEHVQALAADILDEIDGRDIWQDV